MIHHFAPRVLLLKTENDHKGNGKNKFSAFIVMGREVVLVSICDDRTSVFVLGLI